jgi:hypothetical protein
VSKSNFSGTTCKVALTPLGKQPGVFSSHADDVCPQNSNADIRLGPTFRTINKDDIVLVGGVGLLVVLVWFVRRVTSRKVSDR